jgi:uncharacterized protein YgiM (DUF1202 family)
LRSTLSRALFSIAVLVSSMFGVMTAFADNDLQAGSSAVVTGTEGRGLRVRAGPGMAHKIVTTVNEGSTVQVVAGPVNDGDDDW